MKKSIQQSRKGLSFGQLVGTVLCAAFGVQSSKNYQRDVSYGKASTFVVAGIIFSLLFIATVSSIVYLVLMAVGP